MSWLGRIYEYLWRDWLKLDRPITYIIIDEQKQSPLAFMLLFLTLGIVVGKYARHHWWQLLIVFGLGILCGHFWF